MFYVNEKIVPATSPLFVSTPTPTRSPESYVSQAEELLKEGKLTQAIQTYEKAILTDPKNVSIYIVLARLQVFTNDYESAVENAENAILLSPNNSMAHAVHGWALGQLGSFLEAEAALKQAIEIDPNNALAYAYYAEILIQQALAGQSDLGTLDVAIEYSKTAINMAPNALETHRARGYVLEYTGNYDEAIQEFEAAVVINNNIADLHLALGRNYRYIEDYARAVEEFNKANALNPADPLPDTYISRTYLTVGEYAKAIQYAQQAVNDAPDDPFMYGNLGTMYYRNKQYNDAITPFRTAIRGGSTEDGETISAIPLDYGRVAEYYFMYGLALARVGECGEAIDISQTLQLGVPDDEISQFNALEIINICQQYIESGVPEVETTSTPETEASETPES